MLRHQVSQHTIALLADLREGETTNKLYHRLTHVLKMVELNQ